MKPFADIEKIVRRILAHHLNIPSRRLSATKNFYTELPMDDTDYLLTLVDIENQFQINIPDEVAFNFRSVHQIAQYLSGRVAA